MAVRKRAQGLEVAHPNAAGIDIGSASHFVAVPPDREDEPVREFKSFTPDLEALAQWLNECGVDTVAMESTGVYWIPLSNCWRPADSPCIWSMRDTSRTSRGASRMFWIASGCSSS